MNTYVLLHFEYKNDITIIIKPFLSAASHRDFDDDSDVIFMFENVLEHRFPGIGVLKYTGRMLHKRCNMSQ